MEKENKVKIENMQNNLEKEEKYNHDINEMIKNNLAVLLSKVNDYETKKKDSSS